MRDNAAPDISLVGDRVALHPSGVVVDTETPLLTSYARFRSAPLDFLREARLHLSGTGWRSYDDFIGRNIFYNGFSDHIKAKVLENPRLQSRISELTNKRLDVEIAEGLLSNAAIEDRRNEMKAQLIQVADSWTDQMICKMDSRRFIRGAYYFATQLLTRAYHQGIHVSSEEVLRLRQVAHDAERKKQSIIFLPCHRSHVDYVSLQLICYRLGLALPIVVAGDNLNFPIVGPFLQHAGKLSSIPSYRNPPLTFQGAMWIRRSFGDDALYTTLVQAYLDTLLQEGHNFECFVGKFR
jgi:glycerol-3-phosphate O-acyltransferase